MYDLNDDNVDMEPGTCKEFDHTNGHHHNHPISFDDLASGHDHNHDRDHDHDNNPPDGSNWELLCLYCHDNEHARMVDASRGTADTTDPSAAATHRPFAGLEDLLRRR